MIAPQQTVISNKHDEIITSSIHKRIVSIILLRAFVSDCPFTELDSHGHKDNELFSVF